MREDDKLKESSQQKTKNEATMESIIQLYEQGELHQHYQRLTSPSIAGDGFDTLRTQPKEFRRCFDIENPFSIYFLAQLVEEATGESTATSDVYELLTKKQQKRVVNPKAYSKENFFSLFRFIRSATDIKLQRYGHPVGLYFLARDVGAHPEQLYLFVRKKQWLQYLVGERALELDWRPKRIELNLSDIDAVCNFLKESYHKDREQFFNTYGSKAGCVFLAQKLKISPRRLSSLLSKEVLTAIMGISDYEFERRFNPHPMRLTLKQVRIVLEFLRSAYKASAEAFLEKYGSRFGIVYLARDLIASSVCKQISLDGLSSILRDGEIVFQLCRPFLSPLIDKKKILLRFLPLHITLPLDTVEVIIQFLSKRYNEDADSFFARYGAEKGVLALAKDLEAERGKKIRLSHLANLISDGKELAKLLEIDDKRFLNVWNPSKKDTSVKKEIYKDPQKIYEKKALFSLAYEEIKKHGILPLISSDIEAYNKGTIDANALVRRFYSIKCSDKFKEIYLDSMKTFVGALIAGGVFEKKKTFDLNIAARAFDVYLTLRANGLIEELKAELASYNAGKISAYTLARRLYQNGILDKAKQIDRNVDSTRTFAFALIASGLLPEKETVGLIRALGSLDLFLTIKESGKLSFLLPFVYSYKKGEISAQTFAKELLSIGLLSSLQDCGYDYDSINSVILALIAGGVLEEKNRVELSRCSGHLDLYRWLQKNGFLNRLRGLIEAYKSGKITEHAFISKLHQSGILSKIDESKKDVDSIATLAWAIAVGENIPKSRLVSLGWEAGTFDLYREMEKNGFIEELRPLTEAYNSGKVSKYAFIRQLHQTSILPKIQESGRDVFSYVTLTNALVSGELIPHDRKTALSWASNAFDTFIKLTEDGNISAYLHDFCAVLNTRIECEEISPALYALHISLLHDSVNQILMRNGRDINTLTFFRVLISGGIIDESLEFLISCAIGALNRAEDLALRELYRSSSSFSDFYREMISNWHSLREDLQSTYTKGAPPEKPFSNSYAWKIWSALSAMEATG